MAIAVDRVHELAARYYASPGWPGAACPLVLHLHGGSFVQGLPAHDVPVARLLCEAGAAVLSLDYPRPPAHPFPRPLESAYAVLVWAQQQRRRPHRRRAAPASLSPACAAVDWPNEEGDLELETPCFMRRRLRPTGQGVKRI